MGPATPRVLHSSGWVVVSGRCWEIRSGFWILYGPSWGIKSVSVSVALQILALVFSGLSASLSFSLLFPLPRGRLGGIVTTTF